MIEDSKSSGGEQILVAIILFIFQMFISAFVSDTSLVSNGTIQLIYSIFVLFETWHLLGTGRIFKKNIVANKKMIHYASMIICGLVVFIFLQDLPFHFAHSSKMLVGAGILALSSAISEEYIFRGLFTSAILKIIEYYDSISFKITVTALITSFLDASLIAVPYILGMTKLSLTVFGLEFGLNLLLSLVFFCVRMMTNGFRWCVGLHFMVDLMLSITTTNPLTNPVIGGLLAIVACLLLGGLFIYLNLIDHQLLTAESAN